MIFTTADNIDANYCNARKSFVGITGHNGSWRLTLEEYCESFSTQNLSV